MPRMTKEEKQAKMEALRHEEQRLEQEWRERELPTLLLKLAARAQSLGAEIRLRIISATQQLPEGVEVGVKFNPSDEASDVFGSTLMSPWQLVGMERSVEQHQKEIAEKIAKLKLARETYDSLTPEQREAIGLTHRP